MHNQILLARTPDVPDAVHKLRETHLQSIRWLGQAACCDPSQVGGKAANLSKLALRYPVPAGFCLAVDALDPHAHQNYHDALLHAYSVLAHQVG